MEKTAVIFVISLFVGSAFADVQVPQFPPNFPKAYKKLGKNQAWLQKIGADYCKEAAQTPNVLPKLASPQYRDVLSKESVFSAVICKNGAYVGLPQTPKDENLKFLTDFEILRHSTGVLFLLYKEAPPSQVTVNVVMNNLRNYESLVESDIYAAYTPPGSDPVYPPTSDIAKWVGQVHDLYVSGQLH